MAENDALKPMMDKENYTLETIQAAYNAITNGKTKGKVVVAVSPG
jgi:NADPH:quinone reductase